MHKVLVRPPVEVVGTVVRVRGRRASVLELRVAIIVHAVMPFRYKDTRMVLELLAEAELVALVARHMVLV